MKRELYANLIDWKNSQKRKPLLLKGARQVGKTYLLKEFGEKEFLNLHYFNFEKDKRLSSIFEPDLAPQRILSELSLWLKKAINPKTDLIFFDEIQECPKALNSLKYFCEEMGNLAICSAGSLLGVSLSRESFPVGKVEFMNLYPLTFREFLMAQGDERVLNELDKAIEKGHIPGVVHDHLMIFLRHYYFTGGMPSAILSYLSSKEENYSMVELVRKTQSDLVDSFHKDFAKHSGNVNAMHIVSVFENIPLQLSRSLDGSVQRYRFRDVIPRRRGYADFWGPIHWLEKAGLILKVKICIRAELPLESFCKENIFKLYLFDIGLLGCMLDLPADAILAQDYGLMKCFIAENFVAQELTAKGYSPLHAWEERNSEIEFLRVIKGEIVPVEVKSGIRTQAKSLAQFILKYSPKTAIKLSAQPFRKETRGVVRHYPLYMTGYV